MKLFKYILSLLFVTGTVMLSTSCEDDSTEGKEEQPGTSEITVSESSITAKSAGGDYFVTVQSPENINVSKDVDWLDALVLIEKKQNNLRIRINNNDSDEERKAIITLSSKNCEDVTITVTQKGITDSDCDLLTFALEKETNGLNSDLTFQYDESTSTFSAMYLKWIEKENPEMMKPVFKIHGAKVTMNGTELISGETEISFSDDFTVTVVAQNGNNKTYKISLNCPQINRELPVLHFKPSSEIISKDDYVDTEIELYDKTATSTGEGWWDSKEQGTVEMRGRGNSTWGLPKKPYRIKFPEKFSPIGLNHTEKKSWTLLAQDMDKSLLRTHLAFEYSRALYNAAEGYHSPDAVLFTPCSKYINVYITGWYTDSSTGDREYKEGEYLGVYQMSDQVEQGKGRIDVEDLDDKDGADPEKITGGYVIETDLHEGNHFSAKKNIKMSYKYPKDDECDPAQYEYITNFINEAEANLYESYFKDPKIGWRKYFDEKTLADFIIIKELVGDHDGYTSTYMYKRRGVDKLFFGPIWDCDKGWNNEKRVPHAEYPAASNLMIYAGFWMPSYVEYDWFQRLWEDNTLREFVAERWASKKAELLAVTERVLDELPASMPKAIEANFTVWPFYYQYSNEANLPAASYPEEIERIRQITYERAELLDKLFR